MTAITECLKYSVGLTKTQCECLGLASDAEEWEDINRSDSGYFLDDMELSPSLQIPKASLECREFWDMMEEAREQGIRDFVTDFLSQSKQHTHIKVTPYDGEFTDNQKINMVLSGINRQYLVAMYRPLKYVRGATMEIKQIGLILNTPGTYTLNVYDSSQLYSDAVTLTPLKTDTITVVTPGVLATKPLTTAWNLPMWKDDRKLTYYFAYDPAGARPYNIKFNCGCSNGSRGWEKHLYGKGIQTDDLNSLEVDSQSYSEYSYGIHLKGSLTCDGFDWLCREWNYQTDSFARVMARLIQLYSIRKLYALILNTRKINAFTLLKTPEAMIQRMSGLTQMINSPETGNMPYLFRNVPKGVTGCWECESKFTKGSIIATNLRRSYQY